MTFLKHHFHYFEINYGSRRFFNYLLNINRLEERNCWYKKWRGRNGHFKEKKNRNTSRTYNVYYCLMCTLYMISMRCRLILTKTHLRILNAFKCNAFSFASFSLQLLRSYTHTYINTKHPLLFTSADDVTKWHK